MKEKDYSVDPVAFLETTVEEIKSGSYFKEHKETFIRLLIAGVLTGGGVLLEETWRNQDIRQGIYNLSRVTSLEEFRDWADYYWTRFSARKGFSELPERMEASELVLLEKQPKIEGFNITQIISQEEEIENPSKYKTGFVVFSPYEGSRNIKFSFEKLEKPGSPIKFFSHHPYSEEKVTLYFPTLFASSSLIDHGNEIRPLTKNNEHPLIVIDDNKLSIKTYRELEAEDLTQTVIEFPDGFYILRNQEGDPYFGWKMDDRARNSTNEGLNYNYIGDIIKQDGTHQILFITCGWYSRIYHHDVASYLFFLTASDPSISEIRVAHVDSGSTRPVCDRLLIPDLNAGGTILYYKDQLPALNDIQYGLMVEVSLGSVF